LVLKGVQDLWEIQDRLVKLDRLRPKRLREEIRELMEFRVSLVHLALPAQRGIQGQREAADSLESPDPRERLDRPVTRAPQDLPESRGQWEQWVIGELPG